MASDFLKIAFAGTPEFAARHLQALLRSQHCVGVVYTQPDRPAGRGKKLTPSPVRALAEAHLVPVKQPVSLKNKAAQTKFAECGCDILVVVAYGLLLPQAILDIPKYGCINVHGSILPRWRGAAPIQRAIEAGDTRSGVTIMQMDAGLDTGDMLLKRECPIYSEDSAADLHDRLCEIGPPALMEALEQIAQGTLQAQKQDDTLSSYAHKIEKAEAEIDWTQDAWEIERKVRAFNPFPICFSTFKSERLRIHKATVTSGPTSDETGKLFVIDNTILVQCGRGLLELKRLQLPGKKTMDAGEFLNGFGHLFTGENGQIRLGKASV